MAEGDTDKDGIPDSLDACLTDPGLPNLDPRQNGCRPKLFISDPVTITLQVQFSSGSAKVEGRENAATLDDVLLIMAAHPELHIVVLGHADTAEKQPKQLGLSRAKAVIEYLRSKGVEESRLEARGVGTDDPVDTADTPAAHEKNRRVSFKIKSE
ncbi:MAG: OmpA family protein [Polyangiaceae bacterium]